MHSATVIELDQLARGPQTKIDKGVTDFIAKNGGTNGIFVDGITPGSEWANEPGTFNWINCVRKAPTDPTANGANQGFDSQL